jgi:hypothetical protein
VDGFRITDRHRLCGVVRETIRGDEGFGAPSPLHEGELAGVGDAATEEVRASRQVTQISLVDDYRRQGDRKPPGSSPVLNLLEIVQGNRTGGYIVGLAPVPDGCGPRRWWMWPLQFLGIGSAKPPRSSLKPRRMAAGTSERGNPASECISNAARKTAKPQKHTIRG